MLDNEGLKKLAQNIYFVHKFPSDFDMGDEDNAKLIKELKDEKIIFDASATIHGMPADPNIKAKPREEIRMCLNKEKFEYKYGISISDSF